MYCREKKTVQRGSQVPLSLSHAEGAFVGVFDLYDDTFVDEKAAGCLQEQEHKCLSALGCRNAWATLSVDHLISRPGLLYTAVC